MTRTAPNFPPFAAIALACALLLPAQTPAFAQHESAHSATAVKTPHSIHVEHEAIHSALVQATKAPGRVGEAAKALARVLHPHFVREEEIATPPLGLLAPLASGAPISDAQAEEALAMSDALRQELPKMLKEHQKIREAIEALRRVAIEEKAPKYEKLANDLALHAQSEEEVLYPAAVLVGDLLRARKSAKK